MNINDMLHITPFGINQCIHPLQFVESILMALLRYLTLNMSRSQLKHYSANWGVKHFFFARAHAINAIISTLWAEPKSKIVSGTLTWSLRTGGHLVMLIICFHHSWLIAEATRLMQVQCDWHFDSVIASQLGIHKQRAHLKYRHSVNYFFVFYSSKVCCKFVLPVHTLSAEQRPCTFVACI